MTGIVSRSRLSRERSRQDASFAGIYTAMYFGGGRRELELSAQRQSQRSHEHFQHASRVRHWVDSKSRLEQPGGRDAPRVCVISAEAFSSIVIVIVSS